jgi:hypothetical protein
MKKLLFLFALLRKYWRADESNVDRARARYLAKIRKMKGWK